MTFVVKRFLSTVPSLLGVIISTFLLSHALPGDPAAYFAGPAANAASIANIRTTLGLDRPLPEQFFYYVNDPKRFVFDADAVRVASARQTTYADRRANPAGKVPDDTWVLRPQEAAADWYEREYLAVVAVIRELGFGGACPGATAPDVYLTAHATRTELRLERRRDRCVRHGRRSARARSRRRTRRAEGRARDPIITGSEGC